MSRPTRDSTATRSLRTRIEAKATGRLTIGVGSPTGGAAGDLSVHLLNGDVLGATARDDDQKLVRALHLRGLLDDRRAEDLETLAESGGDVFGEILALTDTPPRAGAPDPRTEVDLLLRERFVQNLCDFVSSPSNPRWVEQKGVFIANVQMGHATATLLDEVCRLVDLAKAIDPASRVVRGPGKLAAGADPLRVAVAEALSADPRSVDAIVAELWVEPTRARVVMSELLLDTVASLPDFPELDAVDLAEDDTQTEARPSPPPPARPRPPAGPAPAAPAPPSPAAASPAAAPFTVTPGAPPVKPAARPGGEARSAAPAAPPAKATDARPKAPEPPRSRPPAQPAPSALDPADLDPADLDPADLAPADLAPADLAPADLAPADLAPADFDDLPEVEPDPISDEGDPGVIDAIIDREPPVQAPPVQPHAPRPTRPAPPSSATPVRPPARGPATPAPAPQRAPVTPAPAPQRAPVTPAPAPQRAPSRSATPAPVPPRSPAVRDDWSPEKDLPEPQQGPGAPQSLSDYLAKTSVVSAEELDFFSDHDHERGGDQDGRFKTDVHNLDRVDVGAEEEAEAARSAPPKAAPPKTAPPPKGAPRKADPVEELEADDAPSARFAAPTLSEEEAVAKIDVANEVLGAVARALDEAEGAGRGKAFVELLVEGAPSQYALLFADVHVGDDVFLRPYELIRNLVGRPPTEHRPLLNNGLLDILERAHSTAMDELPDESVDALLEATAGYRSRLGR